MTIDKYTKIVLTVIAAGILGINFYFYNGNFIKEAKAEVNLIDLIMIEDAIRIGQDDLMRRIALSEVTITSRINTINKEQEKAIGMNLLTLMAIANELGVSKDRLNKIIEEAQKFVNQ